MFEAKKKDRIKNKNGVKCTTNRKNKYLLKQLKIVEKKCYENLQNTARNLTVNVL